MTVKQLIKKFKSEWAGLDPNVNCLEDFACPKCGNRSAFRIQMSSIFTLTDDGTDGYEDTNWASNAYCQCKECQHEGTVRDFKFRGLDDEIEYQTARANS